MEYIGIIVSIIVGIFTLIGCMLTMFLWNRGESNADRRHHSDGLDSLRRDIDSLHKRIHHMSKRNSTTFKN